MSAQYSEQVSYIVVLFLGYILSGIFLLEHSRYPTWILNSHNFSLGIPWLAFLQAGVTFKLLSTSLEETWLCAIILCVRVINTQKLLHMYLGSCSWVALEASCCTAKPIKGKKVEVIWKDFLKKNTIFPSSTSLWSMKDAHQKYALLMLCLFTGNITNDNSHITLQICGRNYLTKTAKAPPFLSSDTFLRLSALMPWEHHHLGRKCELSIIAFYADVHCTVGSSLCCTPLSDSISFIHNIMFLDVRSWSCGIPLVLCITIIQISA